MQPQKTARGLKFRILEVGGLYYLCSENKGAVQLRSYREADLRLCFRICKKPVFSRRGSNIKIARIKGIFKLESLKPVIKVKISKIVVLRQFYAG